MIMVMLSALLVSVAPAEASTAPVTYSNCRVGPNLYAVARTYHFTQGRTAVRVVAVNYRDVPVTFGPDSVVYFKRMWMGGGYGVRSNPGQWGNTLHPLDSSTKYVTVMWFQYENPITGLGEFERSYRCTIKVQ